MSHPFDAVTVQGEPYRALPDPMTGKTRKWTRTTTFIKALEDNYNLVKWRERKVAQGIAARPDLAALAAAIDDTNSQGRGDLNRVADDAVDAAGGSAKRNMGTALHALTERLDRGERVQVPTTKMEMDIYAYKYALDNANIEILPAYIERQVAHSALGVAGTFDRIVRLPNGDTVIADLKTGSNLDYSWMSIAMQLAIYANAAESYGVWSPKLNEYLPAPADFKHRYGIVIHLPSGTGTCTLYEVDLMAGWDLALLAHEVRQARKGKYAAPYAGKFNSIEAVADLRAAA